MKFKVGDKIRYYSVLPGGKVFVRTLFITGIKSLGSVLILQTHKNPTMSENFIWAHPKQCRRLVKRTKPKRTKQVAAQTTSGKIQYIWPEEGVRYALLG